ncbi:MAG: sigma-70 family RNA polymerase sigma factor [Bacteroidia bacterium]|nr:sigma-70 family RNA polymerase sigma factor [Bacteroidia bacterium]
MVTPREMSDKQLIAIFRKGNNSGITELLRRHKKQIYTSIFFLVRDKEKADDLFQDTFIHVIEAIRQGKYNDQGYFRAWAVRIAHNIFIDQVRVEKRRKMIRNTEEFSVLNTIPSEEELKDKTLIRNEEEETIRELIQKVPLIFREVLIMRHYGDMSFDEISKTLNINLNTALGRMRYALKYIRKIMEEEKIVLR